VGKPEIERFFKDLVINGTEILNEILRKFYGSSETRFVWLMTGTSGDTFKYCSEILGCVTAGDLTSRGLVKFKIRTLFQELVSKLVTRFILK